MSWRIELYGEPGLLEVDGARYLVADETGRIYADEALHQYGEELVFSTESGALLCNGSWHDFQFDDQGYYTTGDAELDGYVEEALAACTDETMTQAEKLYAAYCYVRSFGYLGRNSTIYVKTMSPTQASAYAKKIFSTGKGDCYNFAAAFIISPAAWAMTPQRWWETAATSGTPAPSPTAGWRSS